MSLVYLTVAFSTFVALVLWSRKKNAGQLPPGPPSRMFGNTHHIPQAEDWLTYKQLAESYGPIICLWMFNSKTIVLNDYRTANCLLEQRSNIYSSRPNNWMGVELAGRKNNVFSTRPSNPRFRIYRRLLQKTLNSRITRTYDALLMAECRTLLGGLLETPDNFVLHLRRNAVSFIMNLAFGYQMESDEDPFVQLLEESVHLINSLRVPGKFMVEFFPLLRFVPEWFPGAGFKRFAKATGQEMRRLEQIPFDWAKSQIAAGSYKESFVSEHIKSDDIASTQEEKEDIIKWCSLSLFIGGGDTTVSALTTFFLLMSLHPDVQRRAQEEIDRVLEGSFASPDHRNSMPYMNAVIKEVMRWGTVGPLGIPHQVTEDDFFEGYYIPKGTRVVANLWAMSYDENVYPNPSVFDPTRFLGNKQQQDPHKFLFGFGRRICPGMNLAEIAIFLNMTNILANFTISKKRDENGQEIEPEVHWTTGVTRHLKPFPCHIEPRSPDTLRSALL